MCVHYRSVTFGEHMNFKIPEFCQFKLYIGV